MPALTVFPALALLPEAARACAVCTGGESEAVGRAFLLGSIALSLLPLAGVAGMVWWLRRRARAIARADAAARVAPPLPG